MDFGVFFIYIYSSLTITVGVFNIDPDIPGSVHVFNGVIEIIAVTFQTILIHQLLIKVVDYYFDYENGKCLSSFSKMKLNRIKASKRGIINNSLFVNVSSK